MSGIGRTAGNVSPERIVTTVRSARTDRNRVLRSAEQNSQNAKLGRSVVLVVTPAKLGTGTLISSDGTILTSWHIIEDLEQVGVIFKPLDSTTPKESDAVQAKVIRIDPLSDLALIKVSFLPKDIKSVELASPKSSAVGSKLSVLGHPYGEIWSHTEGTLSQFLANYKWQSKDGTQHQADVIKFKTPVVTGNSGGPILDRKNKLLAIDAFSTAPEQLVGIGVSVNSVKKLITARAAESFASRAAIAPKATCEPTRLETRRTKPEDGTVHVLDLNCNGRADAMMLVPDDRKKANLLSNDANENGITDSVYFDFERDGKFDEVTFDTNEDGNADLIGRDLDERLVPRRLSVLE
jgi:S1-C subfamily serine protease